MEVPYLKDPYHVPKTKWYEILFFIVLGGFIGFELVMITIALVNDDNAMRADYLDQIQTSLIIWMWADFYWFRNKST